MIQRQNKSAMSAEPKTPITPVVYQPLAKLNEEVTQISQTLSQAVHARRLSQESKAAAQTFLKLAQEKAEAAAKNQMAAHKHAAKSVGELESFIRTIHKKKIQNHMLNNAEIAAIKDSINQMIKVLGEDSELLPRLHFIRAVFEERLGRSGNAIAMYTAVQAKFPDYRRTYAYHADLLNELGFDAECKALLKQYVPTYDEMKKYQPSLKRLAQEAMSEKNPASQVAISSTLFSATAKREDTPMEEASFTPVLRRHTKQILKKSEEIYAPSFRPGQ